jgi:hypothetical protein
MSKERCKIEPDQQNCFLYNQLTNFMEQSPFWEADRKLTDSQLVKKFPTFYGTQGSLPHSQEPATCPYPEPDQFSPCPPSYFLKIHFNVILLDLPSSLFPSGFPTQIFYAPLLSLIHATYPAHLILLYLITHIIFGYEYRSLSSLLCSLLHSPVTSSLLGPSVCTK